MQRMSPFKITLVTISLIVTGILLLAVGSLFLVPSWSEVWTNLLSEEMQFSLMLSLWTGLTSATLVLLFALPIGYTLSRFDFPGKGIAKTIMDLPIAFPELVLGLCLLLVFGNTPLGKGLEKLGFQVVFSKTGVVVAQFFTALPYAVRIMKSTFDYVPPRLEFVSRSLGYSSFDTFRHVTLPLARNGILAAAVISFARCIGTFGTVLILAGGTYMKTETLPITLYLNMSYGNMGMALTSGVILVLVSFIAIFIVEKTEVGV